MAFCHGHNKRIIAMKIVFLEMKSLARNLRENRVLNFKSISIDMFNFFLILTLVVAFNSFKIQKTEIINLFLLYFFFITLLSTNTELHKLCVCLCLNISL